MKISIIPHKSNVGMLLNACNIGQAVCCMTWEIGAAVVLIVERSKVVLVTPRRTVDLINATQE
jgi:hypothetical protein